MQWKPVTFMLICVFLAACRIEIQVPAAGGTVRSETTGKTCGPGFPPRNCQIDVKDTSFEDTFVAVPDDGYAFAGWQRKKRGFCGGSQAPCALNTAGFAGNSDLLAFLRSDDEVFFLEPVFEQSGGDGGDEPGGGGGGGSGGDSGAGSCFNADLVRDGTRLVASYRSVNSDGTATFDQEQEAFGGASYEGKPARQIIIDLEITGDIFSTARIESFAQVDVTKMRVKNLYSKTDVFSPEAATIEVRFEPPQLERFDLEPGESYSQTYVADERTNARGQTFTQSIEVTDTTTYIGRRTVTVPAGTFETCLFESESRITGPFPAGGVSQFWFSVGTGLLVKEIGENGRDSTELLSAKINGKSI